MDLGPQIVEWSFQGLVTGIFGYAAMLLSGIKKAIETLNIKMAVVVEQISSHDKRIEKLENKEEDR